MIIEMTPHVTAAERTTVTAPGPANVRVAAEDHNDAPQAACHRDRDCDLLMPA
jgi:hypothetical protein